MKSEKADSDSKAKDGSGYRHGSPDNKDRDRDRDRSRRGDRPSRFSGGNRDRSPIRERRKGDRRVYVSNVAYESRWQDIKDLFRTEVGEVTFVEMFVDENDKPRGCGVVEFESPELALKAIEKMHRFDLKGRKLVVKEDFDVERDKYGRVIPSRNRGGGDRDASLTSSSLRSREDSGRNNWESQSREQLPSLTSLNTTNSSSGGSSSNSSKWGNTYGLSPQFLESLWINGPLYNKVFVANLDYKVDEKKLREVFKLAGRVVNAEIIVDKEGKSRGFGVVEYEHPVEAVQAISMLHNQTLFDRRLTVRMDRVNDKPEGPPKLPEGLKGLGMGLGANGIPLNDVVRNLPTIQNSPFALANAQTSALAAAAAAASLGQNTLNAVSTSQLANLASSGNLNAANLNASLAGVGSLLGSSLSAEQLATLGNLGQSSLNNSSGLGSGLGAGLGSGLTSGLASGLASSLTSGLSSGLGSALNQSLSSLSSNIASTLGSGINSGLGGSGNLGTNAFGSSNSSFLGCGGGGGGGGSVSNFGNPSGNVSNYGASSRDFDSLSAALSGGGNFNELSARDNFRGLSGSFGNGSSRNPMGSLSSGNLSSNNTNRSDTVCIKNLPPTITWQQLRDKFQEVGEVKFAEMRNKDMGLVRFSADWQAERAVNLLDRTRIDGRTISVRLA